LLTTAGMTGHSRVGSNSRHARNVGPLAEGASTVVGAAVRAETPATARNSTSTAELQQQQGRQQYKRKLGYKGTLTTAGSPKLVEMEY
jgi:hypothetical protein